MSAIVQSMKLLARGDTSRRERVDVCETLEIALGAASNVIRYRARLVRDLADVGGVEANASQLAQVFVNLLMNAAEALPEETVERNEIRVSTRREGGDVVIEIADNGCGIREELRSRIFEPFFTTKDVGAGMGLGLSISNGIVKGFGGTISVQSKAGEGSMFLVRLPAAPAPRPQTRAPAPSEAAEARVSPPATRERRARVLIVDDEPALAKTLQRVLADEFDITVLNRGRDAVAALCGGEPDFDVILCDLMMPEVTGAEVHAQVTAARPELAQRFIFMTGGAFTPRGRQFLETVKAPILEKPFALARIREVISAQVSSLSDVE